MDIKQFTDDFLNSDFARKNLYTHMQPGFPLPVHYENGVAIRFLCHKLACTKENITLSDPKFEIVLAYPSARILHFSEISDQKYNTNEAVFSKQEMMGFAHSFEQMYNACDELLQFYDEHKKVTQIMYKKFYERLDKEASKIGFSDWYGGIYDSSSSI